MKAHELKVNKGNWNKYLKGESWSIRNNDRDFKQGDVCKFSLVKDKATEEIEKDFDTSFGTTEILKQITAILYHKDFPEGIQEGYCILTLVTLKQFKGVER